MLSVALVMALFVVSMLSLSSFLALVASRTLASRVTRLQQHLDEHVAGTWQVHAHVHGMAADPEHARTSAPLQLLEGGWSCPRKEAPSGRP